MYLSLSSAICLLPLLCSLTTAYPQDPHGSKSSNEIIGFGASTTGGKGGREVTVTNAADLHAAVSGVDPKIVYVQGYIKLDARVKVGNNTSIIGIGSTAEIEGYGLQIANATNVIVRNVGIWNVVDTDCISATFSDHLWVDHCEFWNERSRGFDYYDGLVDLTKGSDFITVSHNYFHSHWKTSLIGGDDKAISTEGDRYHVTYHHNFFRDLGTRTPAIRFGQAHIFNNYFQNISDQAVHPRSYAQVLVEGNKFEDVKEPISTYGLVIPADSPNTSPLGDYEIDGFAVERNNIYVNCGPNNITEATVGNFTEPPYKYKHVWTPVEQVQSVVIANAGRGHL